MQGEFFKLGQIRCITDQGLTRELQTARNQIRLVIALTFALNKAHKPYKPDEARPE
jgi:hypothetical protein